MIAGHSHFVAINDGEVIGWSDVQPLLGEMRAHCGVLGIGIAKKARGQGIGRKLMETAIAKAKLRGLTRIGLTVRADNLVAQSLYKSMGFVVEGTQRKGWQLRGEYFDVYHMALVE